MLSNLNGTKESMSEKSDVEKDQSQDDLQKVSEFFEANASTIERWLKEKAPDEVINQINSIVSKHRVCEKEHRSSVTSELYQQWLSSSATPLKLSSPSYKADTRKNLSQLDEGELFMELIKDVANELDIDVLCHKILVNVGLLTHADRGSLFLVKGGNSNSRYLVAKLFDVTQDTALDDAIRLAKSEELIIPFGVGIAGHVAETKEILNIKDAYKDPRFNSEIDLKTGYKTNIILSMPICNYEGEVIGVAQIINKTNGQEEFTERDVEVFRRYLTFCGIGIQNAQLFENSVLEYKRNQILLNLARSIFEEQNNLECLVTKIMKEARDLLKCERCAVFLVDLECCESSHLERMVKSTNQIDYDESNRVDNDAKKVLQAPPKFTRIFEMGGSDIIANINRPSIEDINSSIFAQIALHVAKTGEILNINDTADWLKNHPGYHCDSEDISHESKCILCMPIVDGQRRVIGVLVYVHANGAQFTNSEISIFEAFAIFCGLGIHNTTMYESACKLMAKQKVALECLSYHATASQDQTVKLTSEQIKSAEEYKLYSFKFIDFELEEEETCRATIRMFVDFNLTSQFHIPYDMKTGKMERFMQDLEILGLLVACLCHDLDHRGTNNAFQLKTDSPLAILYTTSTMEHHHFDQCVMILNSEGNNIFQALSPEDYRYVMNVVESAILSTDLAMYFKKRDKFLELIDNGEFDWQSDEKKELLCGMMMTACDVSAIAKPWEVQHSIAKLVADEFFDQGDLEKLQLNTKPIAMMDRERKDELPKMQVGFIDVICMPLYKVLSETFPWISPLYEGTVENRKHWQDLAEKVEMGLTWIDHDTIDQPIEELAANAIDRGDIEFTVCELNCHNAQQDDQGSPVHERKPRFSSFKKSGALSKAVRSKLNLTKSSTQSSEKQNSCGESSSFDQEKGGDSNENGSSKEFNEPSTSSSTTSKPPPPNKVTKKKSKLCLLL
ncbi:CLUMA_CG005663, isoform A [Clunio marinus]|uniref:Phosphodiesterase n=1 Tax=Clunio marinus TaxID=568069 RepID=A0A1J1HZW5_9DIPT|nr:CLUMA_CG005663, isoform A [Clunio marinus]